MFPAVMRKDYFCNDCKKLFSLYLPKEEQCKPHCPFCADNMAIERYSYRKHGSVEGKQRPWTRHDVAELKRLLDEPLTWDEIAAKVGREKTAIRKYAERRGLKRKYDIRASRG
jgi:hypothetical protein